jgi:hypothetical protein
VRAATDEDVAPPWEVIEMGLCERLNCLPSHLENEDIGAILLRLSLLDLYHALQKRPSELSDAEKIRIGKALQMEINARTRT